MGILSKIQESFGKSQEERDTQKDAESIALERLRQGTQNIRNGIAMPEPMQPDGRLILEQGENVYLILPGMSYLEERTKRVNYGGAGASVRVVKGVSIRAGGGTAVPVRNIEVVDNGTLYITNKNVTFIGAKNNMVLPLKKIISCDCNPNELHIASSTKKTPLILRSIKPHPEVMDYADASIKSLIAHAT